MDNQSTESLTLTPKKAAALIGVSMPTMYELCRRSDFPTIRLGRKIIIPLGGLKKWIEESAVKRA